MGEVWLIYNIVCFYRIMNISIIHGSFGNPEENWKKRKSLPRN